MTKAECRQQGLEACDMKPILLLLLLLLLHSQQYLWGSPWMVHAGYVFVAGIHPSRT